MLDPIVLSIPLYFILIGIELLVQLFSGRNLYRLNDALTNISCGVTQQLTGVFAKIFSVGIYAFIFTSFRLFEIPSGWITWIILFIAVDFCYYWAHRMSHEINLFWGGHVVHHQSEDYNLSVALRQSTFQVVWTFAFYLPLALIGFDPTAFVVIAGLTTVYQFWIHTDTIGRMGFLELFMNTPSHHRVHHGRDPKYIDRNHAAVFIIWDKMFGTFQKEEEKPTYGITRPIRSWNPVWANLDHYIFMLHQINQIEGSKNKVKYLFKKPGWLPENMGGYQATPDVDKKSHIKYNLRSIPVTNGYVLFQYALNLGLAIFFIFKLDTFTVFEQIGLCLAIIATAVVMGGLIENKRWAVFIEYLRVTGFTSAIVYIGLVGNLNLLLISLVAVFFILSVIWLQVSHRLVSKLSHSAV